MAERTRYDHNEEKEQSNSNNDEPEKRNKSALIVYTTLMEKIEVPPLFHDPSWKVVQCLCSRYLPTDLQHWARGILWLRQQQRRL
jgi:hypothetical protein